MERVHLLQQGHINNPSDDIDAYLFEELFNFKSFVAEEEVQQPEGLILPANVNMERTSNNYYMSFLQMLKSVEEPSFTPSFLRLTQLGKQPWNAETQIQAPDFESCVSSQEMVEEMQSPPQQLQQQDQIHSASYFDDLSNNECNQQGEDFISAAGSLPGKFWADEQVSKASKQKRANSSTERKKRKRSNNPRPAKSKEDAEAQRMNHITVERDRRRAMNAYLTILRSSMPPYYVSRGDQASIVSGAINFVKELEQTVLILEDQKAMKMNSLVETEASSSPIQMNSQSNVLQGAESNYMASEEGSCSGKYETKQNGSGLGNEDIQITVIHDHINLKFQCSKRPVQLLKIIVALEDFRLTVAHLNVTPLQCSASVHYSISLKVEEDCKLGSTNEIVAVVHQILNFIS